MKPLKEVVIDCCGGDEAKAVHLSYALFVCGSLSNALRGLMEDAQRQGIPTGAFNMGLAISVAMATATPEMRDALLRVLDALPPAADGGDVAILGNLMAEACTAIGEEAKRRQLGETIDRINLQ